MPIWIVLGVCAAVFVLCVAIAGARGAFNGGMGERESDLPPAERLAEDFELADLDAVRFTPALWGYRPAEVDAALNTLRERLRTQTERVKQLESRPGAPERAAPQRSVASVNTTQGQVPQSSVETCEPAEGGAAAQVGHDTGARPASGPEAGTDDPRPS